MISLNPTRKKLWAPRGSKPVQLVNGSHQNVCFFSAVSDKKNHCCATDWINSENFIKFCTYMLSMHQKLVLILDRATHHHKSKKVKEFAKKNKNRLVLWFLPKKLPELNPAENGWKSSRKNVTYKLFKDKKSLGQAVRLHIRNEFKTNLFNFWS